MDSASSHRKIELQSPEDLTYLIGNVRRAVEDSINAAFPPVEGAAGQDDELRTRIEQLVHEYIRQTFTLAAPNLSINGLPVEPALFLSSYSTDSSSATSGNGTAHGSRRDAPQEQYEPFDGRKRERVEVLAREEEDLLREIASLKRRVPAAAAAARADMLREAVRADEEQAALERTRAETAAAAASASGKGGIEIGLLERQAAVETSFAAAVATLERLKRDMPATVAKMERARVAGEYVVTER